MMAQTPFDQYGLPEGEICLAIAELIANSGSPLFARYYPDRVDQEAWEHVYQSLRKAREVEKYLYPRQSKKYAAILISQSSLDNFDHLGDKPEHLGSLKGFSKGDASGACVVRYKLNRGGSGTVWMSIRYWSCQTPAVLWRSLKVRIVKYIAQGGGFSGLRPSRDV